MKLIIDIDEETYKKCKWKNNGVVGLEWWERAIANGTQLPKGHGRLIDADAFAIRGEYFEKLYGSDFYWEFKKQLDSQFTIIEADTENKE